MFSMLRYFIYAGEYLLSLSTLKKVRKATLIYVLKKNSKQGLDAMKYHFSTGGSYDSPSAFSIFQEGQQSKDCLNGGHRIRLEEPSVG